MREQWLNPKKGLVCPIGGYEMLLHKVGDWEGKASIGRLLTTLFLLCYLSYPMQQQQQQQPSTLTDSINEVDDSLIAALLVVGFHHAYGPIVEFCVPPLPQYNHEENSQQDSLQKLELPEEWSFLPFLALPGNVWYTCLIQKLTLYE